jgi:hypothetical protein
MDKPTAPIVSPVPPARIPPCSKDSPCADVASGHDRSAITSGAASRAPTTATWGVAIQDGLPPGHTVAEAPSTPPSASCYSVPLLRSPWRSRSASKPSSRPERRRHMGCGAVTLSGLATGLSRHGVATSPSTPTTGWWLIPWKLTGTTHRQLTTSIRAGFARARVRPYVPNRARVTPQSRTAKLRGAAPRPGPAHDGRDRPAPGRPHISRQGLAARRPAPSRKANDKNERSSNRPHTEIPARQTHGLQSGKASSHQIDTRRCSVKPMSCHSCRVPEVGLPPCRS